MRTTTLTLTRAPAPAPAGARSARPGHRRPARVLAVAVTVAAALAASAVNARPAQALDPQTVITAAKTAYSAYQMLQADKLTLAQATDKILDAIDDARSAIISHLDRLAAAHARSCAKTAIDDLEHFESFTTSVAQQYARDTGRCVNDIDSLVRTVTDKAALDQLGFALNSLGPVALLAHRKVGFSVSSLRSNLKAANGVVISKLYPTCQASPLLGDAVPGGMVEVMLRCRAYNGDIGADTAFTTNPKTATYNFTLAANRATRNTSRALAQAVLPTI